MSDDAEIVHLREELQRAYEIINRIDGHLVLLSSHGLTPPEGMFDRQDLIEWVTAQAKTAITA